MSQLENKNGDKVWIHRAHIRRLAPRPRHLSDITPPLPLCDTFRNTQDHPSPRTSGAHNSTQTFRPSNITPQQTQNERKQMPIRLTRGRIHARFQQTCHPRTTYTHSPPDPYLVEEESQSRTTYTHSPPDSYLMKEESLYLFEHTDFYLSKNKRN